MWKSTVTPEPEPDEDEIFADGYGRPRNRVSQLFQHAFRPLRSRRESSSTISSLDRDYGSASGHHSPTPPFATSPTEEQSDPIVSVSPFSRFMQQGSPKLTKSHSVEQLSSVAAKLPSRRSPPILSRSSGDGDAETTVLQRSVTSISLVQSNTIQPIITTPRRPNSSRSRTVSHSSISAPLHHAPQAIGVHGPTHPAPKWSFLRFLTRDSSQTSILPERPSTPDSAVKRHPRKGEVVCLDYRTLDDKGMRKLEGRSDHRPVIGSYAIYV